MAGGGAKRGGRAASLFGTVFGSVLGLTVAVVLVVTLALIAIFYLDSGRSVEEELSAAALDVAEGLNAVDESDYIALLESQLSDSVRYTLIDADGAVLYDSEADVAEMGNHADRPEVSGADSDGAVVERYSETLATDTVYAAVRLDDGMVVRLSQTHQSLLSFLSRMAVPIVVALVLAVLLAFVLSRVLTRRIMKPIDSLDFSEVLNNEVYEEMQPLLIRIDEQQNQLKQQNAELAEADNMRRDFSSNVSHEMKTPLQVISGYAELMKSGMVDPADYQKFSTLIYDEAQNMRSLINDVLMLSKLDESAFERDLTTPIDLLDVARHASERLEALAEERGVRVSVEGCSASIVGNETLAGEMLHNLIENGIRYNHEGGTVVVSVGRETVPHALPTGDRGLTPQQAVAYRSSPSGSPLDAQEQVVVRVSDTGPGIAPELQEKVFERFFRIDKSRSKETGGTGLGLAIVKHAVLYHSGTISVDSVEGQGTTFELRFRAA